MTANHGPHRLRARRARRLPAPADLHAEIPNPVIVVEVLSPSTAADDHGVKLDGYFRFPACHYLILDPDRRVMIHHRRGHAGAIETRVLRDGVVVLVAPDSRLRWRPFSQRSERSFAGCARKRAPSERKAFASERQRLQFFPGRAKGAKLIDRRAAGENVNDGNGSASILFKYFSVPTPIVTCGLNRLPAAISHEIVDVARSAIFECRVRPRR